MQGLPPEIHLKIFSFTTYDDGGTIRSISRLSKYYRNLVEHQLYDVVSIAQRGPKDNGKFPKLLRRLYSPSPRLHRVFHLFIHFTTDKPTHTDLQAFRDILDYASRTVRSLAIVLPKNKIDGRFYDSMQVFAWRRFIRSGTKAPHLQQLSIRGAMMPLAGRQPIVGFFSDSDSDEEDVFKASEKFPALTHLHLSDGCPPHAAVGKNEMATIFPNLTHIRFTLSTLGNSPFFPTTLRDALSNRAQSTSSRSEMIPIISSSVVDILVVLDSRPEDGYLRWASLVSDDGQQPSMNMMIEEIKRRGIDITIRLGGRLGVYRPADLKLAWTESLRTGIPVAWGDYSEYI